MKKSKNNLFKVRFVKSEKDVARCYDAIHALYPELSCEDFVRRVLRQFTEGYRLVCLEKSNNVKSIIGFRISNILSRGKSIYVEDFATVPSSQSMGFGNDLFDWVCRHAISQGCAWVHLDCRVQNFKGHKFYSRKGMDITSYHFGKLLKKDSQ